MLFRLGSEELFLIVDLEGGMMELVCLLPQQFGDRMQIVGVRIVCAWPNRILLPSASTEAERAGSHTSAHVCISMITSKTF